jgi:hypothetical protein
VSLPNGTFAAQSSLQQLYLYDTKLTTISSNLFANLASIQTLDVSLSPAGLVLESGAFAGVPYTAPVFDAKSDNETGLWLIGNANMTIASDAFGVISTFFCGQHYLRESFPICPSRACADQCGPNSICQVHGFLQPDSVFSCITSLWQNTS